jgi:hypothetical protein
LKNGKLLIHPVAPDCTPDFNNVLQLTDSIGFTGSKIGQEEATYRTGNSFLQLVTFMGCSPHVRFEPAGPDDDDYCYIRFLRFEKPGLLASDNSRTPVCSHCRKPAFSDWSALADAGASPLVCQHCGAGVSLAELRWRPDAGMARFFIEINNIFPGEAQPVDSFMQRLEEATGTAWRYFYLLQQETRQA